MDPEVPTKATKAQIGGVIGAAVAALSSAQAALGDGVITSQEWVGIAIAGLVGLGAVFGSVYAVTNRPKV